MKDLWVILVGDNDIDYVRVFGVFTSAAEANAVADLYPDDDSGENQVRVEKIQSLEELSDSMSEDDR